MGVSFFTDLVHNPTKLFYLLMLGSLIFLGVGFTGIYRLNSVFEMMIAESKARNAFHNQVNLDIKTLNTAISLSLYTGLVTWETEYFDAYDRIKNLGGQREKLELDNPDTELDNLDLFIERVADLAEFDTEIFEKIHTEGPAQAKIVLNSLEREKKLSQLDKSLLALTNDFKEDEENDQRVLKSAIKQIYAALGFVALIFFGGFLFSGQKLWFWIKSKLKQEKVLYAQLASQSQIIVQEREHLVRSQKMVELGLMAGGIGHEILNPLSSSIMSLELLRSSLESSGPVNEKINKNLNRVRSSLDRIAKIVKGLKSFARDADKDDFEKVKLFDIWENIFEISHARFKQANIELTAIGFEKEKMLDCTSVQIEQIIMNLIANAFDAIEGLPEKWVKVSVEDAGENYLFKATDSGRGITKDVVERMFQPMFTTKPIGKGTGFGLSLILKIIEKHNGKFWYNEQSQNTEFCFLLPKNQKAITEKSKLKAAV
jgi:C4-dicarboxylate-specific signal transduction histidine kinase